MRLREPERSGGLKGEDGDLGRTGEAEGQADGSDAAIDVELHLAEAEVSHHVFLAHGGEDERAVEWHTDLASVRVAGEHEVDELAARVLDDGVRIVGFVNHEDDRAVGLLRDRQIEIRMAGSGVVSTTEPDSGARALDGHVLVDEDGNASGA